MQKFDLNDTIAAIATGVGESGIGIVRISGKEALKIADKIFVSKASKKPSSYKTYTTHYGWIVDSNKLSTVDYESSTNIVDEIILTVMRAPRSYTKEDVVEINCHGGIVALRRALDLVLENGCRLAEPGEFTKRAFLNGRIDLAQAEAVVDIIRAKTDYALKRGTEQLRGTLSAQINSIRKALLEILAILEANIDFPEEEINPADIKKIYAQLNNVQNDFKDMLESSRKGRILREGISVVICGRPNVGKSSLLNALLKQERSIVTPVAGTTRDTIEEVIDIRGIPVRIVDTAGIIEPQDLVEKKAVQRSKRYIDSADLVILLFDGSKRLTKDDRTLIAKLKKRHTIALINKIDLKQKIEKDKVSRIFKYAIGISAKKAKNINLLEEAIVNKVYAGKVMPFEPALVANTRHIKALKEAKEFVAQTINSLDNKLSLEFIAQGLKEALGCIDDILGRRFSQDLLDKIFRDFCIGK